ncbi:DNA mismatch repair endonuclease MutL [Candidatus Dojkabacteria bacterium]|nr:DNA mismatch repair endonuclease MutL [Candidatus Dojkabacteria bacterium]
MIIKLHPNLINKIAAGEVVERPASVLKELIENSIDADATKISINLEKAGTEHIEVVDNGVGMDKEDAKLALESHTTSKISTVQDLEAIETMGFRGEALASIASVSQFELITMSEKGEVGTKVTVLKKGSLKTEEFSTNQGTKVVVKNLFYNVPARRKFLRSINTEYKHILTTFHNYALAFPHIHFTLSHNKKTVYNLPSVGKESFSDELLVRINDLLGNQIATNLVPIVYNSPYIQISGFAGHPKIARRQRSYQLIFLNRRPIADKLITKAVYNSYHGLIPKDKYPIFFMFLKIDPSKIDVNVHPRKSEVRFSDSQLIFRSVMDSAKHSLLKFLKSDAERAIDTYSHLTKRVPTTREEVTTSTKGQKRWSQIDQFPKREFTKENLIQESIKFTRALLKSDDLVNFAIPKSFQIFNSYIVLEKGDTIQIIDQHAAAERVTFEKLNEQFKRGTVETQELLIPEIVELNKVQFINLTENREGLHKLGLKISIFGKKAVKVTAIPAMLARTNIKELILDIVSELEETQDKNTESLEDQIEQLIATMACHTSIRAGMKLTTREIDDLIRKLLKCKNQYACPHGRPITWELKRKDLEKNFERH